MKPLLAVIKKELQLIKNQKMSLALIIVYPLLVIGALGLAFGGNIGMERVDVALFIPSEIELGSFDSGEIAKMLEDTNKVKVQLASSPEEAKSLVMSGESDFGIVVRQEKTAQGQIVTDLLLDNSNFIVSGMFSPIAKAAIQMTSYEVSSRAIRQLWDRILPIKKDLEGEVQKIELYLADLEEAEAKIDSLQQKISGINISGLEGTLNTQSRNVEATKNTLAQFNSDYSGLKADLAGTKQSLESADAKLESYQGKVSGQVAAVQEYSATLSGYEQQLLEIANDQFTPPSTKSDIMAIYSQVSSTRQQMNASIIELQQISLDIQESRQMIATMSQNLAKAEATLDREKSSLDGMNSKIEGTTGDIEAMNTELRSLGDAIDEINALVNDAKATKQDVSEKLENSRAMLQSFMGILGEFGEEDPVFLSSPIKAFEKNIYENVSPLTFITPLSLALVLLLTCLLFTTISVITEKNDGCWLRMKLSSTNATTLILGKVVGQMLFAFLVSIVILAIGLLVFQIQLRAGPLEIFAILAIAAFSFIALGMFITNFAKTQSTAILASLILILPMIFLSGTILPLPLMSQTLQSVSGLLPLTAANQLFLGVLIRGNPLTALWPQITILLLPAIALMAYTIKKF